MAPSAGELPWPTLLQRARRTVVVVDMVESVRLMEAQEEETVRRWQQFVGEVATHVLPSQQGRLVKSLGDGLLCEFPDVSCAVGSALRMQQLAGALNASHAPSESIQLRIGAHTADVIVDDLDVYGSGVNLAARMMSLAGPGEIVVTAEVRDHLTAGLDADVEDLGECYLKHVAQPVRAYRVGPAGASPVVPGRKQYEEPLQPTIAVIPFDARNDEPGHEVIGELIADGVIAQLSRSSDLRVISRLSSTVFRGRSAATAEIETHLGATYVLSGSYHAVGSKLVLVAELAQARNAQVMWSERLVGDVSDLLQPHSELISSIAENAHRVVLQTEVRRALTQPLPTLESFSLLLGAVSLMHRANRADFERVKDMLDHLIERNRRLPVPRAWLAKWYVLRVTRGWSEDTAAEARQALDQTHRALDLDSDCSLALAIEGFVHCHMRKDLETAALCYEQALSANPNDSLAWLFRSVLYAFKGEGPQAVANAQHSLKLSPLDPLRYFYDSLSATAALANGDYEQAIELAERSLRANRLHASTWRVLAISQSQLGRMDEASKTVSGLLQLQPALTVQGYLERSPAAAFDIGRQWAEALQRAGLPR